MSYTASYIVNSSSAQGTTDFQFTFPYIQEDHIEVYVNYNKITRGSGSNQYQVITNVSPKLIRLNTGIASANLRVEVLRNSSLGTPIVDYADGSTLTANDLDTSALQSLYIDQELKDSQNRTVTVDEATGLPTLNDQRLTDVADPVAAQDAATKNYVDTNDALKVNKGGDTMSGALAMGTNKVTGVGDPTAAQDVVTKAYLERAGSITSTQILDGTIVDGDISGSAAITGSKLQLASGSNPGALSTSGFNKLGNIEDNATADQTNAEIRAAVEAASDSNVFTDADHSKLNGIETAATADQTAAEIRGLVESASDSNVFTDADHTKLNAIEANATADQTASEIKTLIASSPLDASHLAPDSVGDSEIIAGALDNRYYTETELNAGQLDNRYYTETEADARFYNLSSGEEIQSGETWSAADNKIATTAAIDARITDLVEEVGGFVPIANETSFPAANPDINNGAGTLVSVKAFASSHTPSGGSVTIANGAGSGNTVTITGCGSTVLAAGFGGIVETTSTLHTYTFHRLTPKATEVTTVAGNITNINTVGNNSTNINTVAANNSNINTVAGISGNVTTVAGISSNVTSVAGNSSNINSVNSNSSNINTVAGAISNVNTVGGAIANVNTVASNIGTVNDFGARYRVASSDPTSNNDEGDLAFNTTSNELRVYNGSAWQGGVTATGNLAGLGANTFTGAQTFISSQTFDGRDVSVDGAKLDGIEAGATADQTAAEIRTLVENAGDSNVFTDADHTKLNGIETGATADQTKSEIEALNINAATLDSIDGVTFARRDQANTFTSATDQKIVLAGSNNPYIRFQEGTTNKAYIQWSDAGYLYFSNDEASRQLRIGPTSAPEYYNGSSWSGLWHQGNDGSGSGLDADTLDGVQGASFLRSDADDTIDATLTTRRVQVQANHDIRQSNGTWTGESPGKIQHHNNILYLQAGTSGIQFRADDGAANGTWNITSTGTLYPSDNAGSDLGGSGNYIENAYIKDVYCNNWIRSNNTDHGLYNVANNNYWYSDDANYWTLAYNGSSGGIRIRDGHGGGVKGYFYANDSSEIGILDNGGNWAVKSTPGADVTIYGQHLNSNSNGSYDIGASGTRWRNVYATNFHGDGSNLTNLPSTGDTPTVKTSNYTASTGDIVVVNASNLTITLPSSPSTGDKVSVRILGGNFCNVARNGQKIEEQNEDLAIDTYDGCAKLVYVDSTRGWLITC